MISNTTIMVITRVTDNTASTFIISTVPPLLLLNKLLVHPHLLNLQLLVLLWVPLAFRIRKKKRYTVAAGVKGKKGWADSKGFPGRQEKENYRDKIGTRREARHSRCLYKRGKELDSEQQENRWKSDRETGTGRTVWMDRVQHAVFRTHAVSCLIRLTSTINSL